MLTGKIQIPEEIKIRRFFMIIWV